MIGIFSQVRYIEDFSYARYFFSDIPILLTILFFIFINTLIKNRKWRIILNIFSVIILLHYYIDTILILYFQSRALIPEIFNYLTSAFSYDFLIYGLLLFLVFIIILIISFIISQKIIIKKNQLLTIISCSILIYWSIFIFFEYNIQFLWNIFTLTPLYKYSNAWYRGLKCETVYDNQFSFEQGEWKKLNIILVFLESFSAIDSANAWGFNNMPLFDKIQNDWIIFTNFIANWMISSSAHISTLYWVIPWRRVDYEGYYLRTRPLPEYLNSLWYNTTFVSAVPLWYMYEREFLKKSWFKKIIWEEAFLNSTHYARDAAPDEDLYNKVLEEIRKQTWKYFIWLQTISFHKPYFTPYWKGQELALKYSEDKLYDFYNNLKKINFFDSGILILIWDHRMMNPIKKWEFEKLWESWSSRSVATIIWSWITKWMVNNNIIQHTDIYNSIKKLIWNNEVKLDKYYNNITSNEINRNWSITVKWGPNYWTNTYDIYFTDKKFYSLETNQLKEINNNDIYEYICSYLKYQDTIHADNNRLKIYE